MAPLPESNTARLFIEYTVFGQEHVSELRLSSGSTSADAVSAYAVLAPLMAALLHTSDAVTGARFAAEGSNISNPLPVASEAGDQTTLPDADHAPNFMSWTGRSNDGRRVRFTFFTPLIDLSTTGYRQTSVTGDTLALMNAVQGATVDARTISGAVPVWNSYTNYGSNAYYQRQARIT